MRIYTSNIGINKGLYDSLSTIEVPDYDFYEAMMQDTGWMRYVNNENSILDLFTIEQIHDNLLKRSGAMAAMKNLIKENE